MNNLNNDMDDILWQRLNHSLFGHQTTADEGLFTYRVMEKVRALDPLLEKLAWHRFLQWAVPMLGAGVAIIFLAARAPSPASLLDEALSSSQTNDQETLSSALQGDL